MKQTKMILKIIGIAILIPFAIGLWNITLPCIAIWYIWKKMPKLNHNKKVVLTISVIIVFVMLAGITSNLSDKATTMVMATIVGLFVVAVAWYILYKRSVTGINSVSTPESLMTEAKSYFERQVAEGGFKKIETNVLLNKDESAYLEEKSKLSETQAVRYSARSGVGVRVMRGVYLGSSKGVAESKQEWRHLDDGLLTLTNQRLIFDGNKENRSLQIKKIISVTPYIDRVIEISVEGRQKSSIFSVQNPFIWSNMIKGMKDLSHSIS